MINLLQIGVDTLNRVATATDSAVQEISLIDLIFLGGWIMIPLAVLFLVTIFVFFERLIAIRKASKIERGYKKRGVSSKEAERRAWATVNKSDKGGRKTPTRTSGSRSRPSGSWPTSTTCI